MTKITKEKKRYYVWCIFLFFALMIYYYGIQRTYYPDEQLLNKVMSLGMVCSAVPVTFRTARLFQMVLYGIVAILTYDLAIRDNKGHINWAVTPLFLLFMGGLPFKCVDYWGDYDNGWDFYPLDRYLNVIFIILVTLTVLYRLNLQIKKYRIVSVIMLVALTIYALLTHAYVYIVVITIAVAVCVAGEFNTKTDNSGKIFVYSIAILLLITLVLRIFDETVGFENKSEISFIVPENIIDNILYLLEAFSIALGFDFSQLGLFNVTALICGIRLLLVTFGFWCIIKNISLKSINVDFFEKVMSYGILLLFAFVCTTFFEDDRYSQNLLDGNEMQNVGNIICVLPLFTILICKNWEKIGDWIHIPCLKSKKIMLITGMLIFLCTLQPIDWIKGMTIQDSKKEAYAYILTELEERGLTNGVMLESDASILSALSRGEHMVIPIECDWSNGVITSKIILPNDWKALSFDFVIISGTQQVEAWKDYYGIPDETIYISNFEILVYRNSIHIGENEKASQRYRAIELQYNGEVYPQDHFTRICKDATQYGPYLPLQSGKYILQIEEEGLVSADFSIKYGNGENLVEYEVINQREDRIIVSFELKKDVEDLEFIICNQSDHDVDIYSYYLLGQ